VSIDFSLFALLYENKSIDFELKKQGPESLFSAKSGGSGPCGKRTNQT